MHDFVININGSIRTNPNVTGISICDCFLNCQFALQNKGLTQRKVHMRLFWVFMVAAGTLLAVGEVESRATVFGSTTFRDLKLFKTLKNLPVSKVAKVSDDLTVTVNDKEFTIPQRYFVDERIQPADVKALIKSETTVAQFDLRIRLKDANDLRKSEEYKWHAGYVNILLSIERGDVSKEVKVLVKRLRNS
ncbi:hypothetical protein Plhal703r1_c26g0108121 [Plasmopara halstedii]